MRAKLRVALLAVGIIALAYVIYSSGPARISAEISRADPLHLVASIALEAGAVMSFAVGWYLIVRASRHDISLMASVKASAMAILGDVALPSAGAGGEALRITYASTRLGLPARDALSAGFLQRMLVASSLAALIVPGSLSGILPEAVSYILLAGSSMAIAIVLALAAFPHAFLPLAKRLGRLGRTLEEIVEGVASAARSRIVLAAAGLALLQATLSSLAQAMALASVGFRPPILMILLAYPVYAVLLAAPTGIPGSIGIADSGTSAIYAASGIPWHAALSGVLMYRIVSVAVDAAFVIPALIGWVKVKEGPSAKI